MEIQAPDHRDCEGEDHEVNEQIANSIPSIELGRVDTGTGPRIHPLRPVVRYWGTFEDRNKHVDHIVQEDNAPK